MAKGQLDHLYIFFELWLIMIFSSSERKLAKRTSVHCAVGLVARAYELRRIAAASVVTSVAPAY